MSTTYGTDETRGSNSAVSESGTNGSTSKTETDDSGAKHDKETTPDADRERRENLGDESDTRNDAVLDEEALLRLRLREEARERDEWRARCYVDTVRPAMAALRYACARTAVRDGAAQTGRRLSTGEGDEAKNDV